ncbi:MAG: pseudouridine synthase [Acidobacteriota bacterium]
MRVRLQKIVSQAGLTSRREAERWIREGRIEVNGHVIHDMGVRVDPERALILVDGRRLPRPRGRLVVALYKPRGVITSMRDPQGRTTVRDLLKRMRERLYPVGRLDYQSEGLLLMTNDGDLAARLMAPRHACPKVYEVKVRGKPAQSLLDRLRQGIHLRGRRTLPAEIERLRGRQNSWLRVQIVEGRKNQIREMFQRIGHPVQKLRRVRIGSLGLGKLRPGEYRVLSEREIERLRAGPRERS